ncbi:polyphosphate kinase 2 family protein [Desulfurobacterium sp.]
MFERYVVTPDKLFDLNKIDPGFTGNFKGKNDVKEEFHRLRKRLCELQDVLYAEGKHKILIVLQGMDTAGKDGTIKHVFKEVHLQGIKVFSFKEPTEEELSHDFLWRVHKHTPGKGEIAIFNRSHYEDVLIVRVHRLVPEKVWMKRYEHIRNFEKMLFDEGTTILKFYLHISKKEQKKRLLERLTNPRKRWKLHVEDVKERKHWDEYIRAYNDAIFKTSTIYAPWFVIPSDKKWFRNYLVAKIIVKKLESLNMKYPEPEKGIGNLKIE